MEVLLVNTMRKKELFSLLKAIENIGKIGKVPKASKQCCGWNACSSEQRRFQSTTTVDSAEVMKHSRMMADWWHPNGPMKALHSMNQIRVPFIRDGIAEEVYEERTLLPLHKKKILDVGCGGGILSEPLAILGAEVTGIDASKELINLAVMHSKENPKLKDNLPTYKEITVEDHAKDFVNHYDAVVCSEVIEHVTNKELFIKSCIKSLRPNGRIFFTTPNRTKLSHLVNIYLAETLCKIVPAGTHDIEKFITPNELSFLLERSDCHIEGVFGCYYSILSNKWFFVNSNALIYALQAVKLK